MESKDTLKQPAGEKATLIREAAHKTMHVKTISRRNTTTMTEIIKAEDQVIRQELTVEKCICWTLLTYRAWI